MTKSITPRISIITPVLNAGKTIEKMIKSVIDQHYENLEFIILDGGSTDGTVDIIKRYETHLTYWQSAPDQGPNASMSAGVKMATGELIALLMADDWYEPGTLYAIAQASIEHPETEIITCGGRIVFYNEATKKYETILEYTTSKQLALNFYNICFAVSAICCHFIRKKVYDQVGYYINFDPHGKNFISSDKEFLLRAVLQGSKNLVIPHLGHNYLSHTGSRTFNQGKSNIIKLYQEHMMIAQDYLANKPLSKEQATILTRWYRDQTIRLTLRTFVAGNIKQGFSLLKQGICELKFSWFTSLASTLITILTKKIVGNLV